MEDFMWKKVVKAVFGAVGNTSKSKIVFGVILALGLLILVGPETCEFAGEKIENTGASWDSWESQSDESWYNRGAKGILVGIFIIVGIVILCIAVVVIIVLFFDIAVMIGVGLFLLVLISVGINHPALLVLGLAVFVILAVCGVLAKAK